MTRARAIVGVAAVVTVFAVSMVWAQSEDSSMTFSTHGWGCVELGQLVRGHGPVDAMFQHVWRQRVYASVSAEMIINQRIHMVVAPELRLFYAYPINLTDPGEADLKSKCDAYLNEIYFSYNFGDIKRPYLKFKLGYFHYRYNPETTNLGEQLFRSEAYPGYIYNIFDQCYARLLGFEIASDILDSTIHQSAVVNSQTFFYPREDYSVSYVASADFFKRVFTVGGGISWDHLFSVDELKTTPIASMNSYYTSRRDSTFIDPFTNLLDTAFIYPDTAYYSFRGIKLMGRFAIDPKPLLPSLGFGREDLKIYGEFNVLGLKNIINKDADTSIQKHPFERLNLRIPWMLGINLPGFTIIDLISIEVGNWNNPFANEFYGPRKNFIPQHYGRNGWSDAINENLKWSIYLKKRFFNHFGVVVAFARDYVFDLDESSYGPNIDFEETYRYHGDYYWRLKFEGDF